jgi:hypothetical protein
MAVIRVQIDADRGLARRVLELHRAGKSHKESRDAAEARVWRLGRTPAAPPVFVGVTNGEPVRLLYDVEIYSDVA